MKKLLVFLLIIASGDFSVQAETVYVSDKVELIWTRTGPSDAYKVKFKLAPGAKFEVLQRDEASGYVEIKDEEGRVAWIEGKYLTGTPTANRLLESTRAEMKELKEGFTEKVNSLERQIKQLQPLKATNDTLQNELAKLETDYEMVRQEKQTYESRFNREVFFAGAAVFIVGMLFGWIFSRFGGKRRNDGWS